MEISQTMASLFALLKYGVYKAYSGSSTVYVKKAVLKKALEHTW
jgi:hypothetical protein